jgi:hypothetical protein
MDALMWLAENLRFKIGDSLYYDNDESNLYKNIPDLISKSDF